MQQASYLEGGPLMRMLPMYLHVNKKSVDDDDPSKPQFYYIKVGFKGVKII